MYQLKFTLSAAVALLAQKMRFTNGSGPRCAKVLFQLLPLGDVKLKNVLTDKVVVYKTKRALEADDVLADTIALTGDHTSACAWL